MPLEYCLGQTAVAGSQYGRYVLAQCAGTNQATGTTGNSGTREIPVVPSDFTGTIEGSGIIQPAL